MNISVHGKTLCFDEPQVMAIINLTPDSFYDGSRKQTEKEIEDRVRQVIAQGATIIDLGAMSTRPGGDFVTEEEELRRMRNGLEIVAKTLHSIELSARYENTPFVRPLLSIDTYRPAVARMAVEHFGADIINDVSEGGVTGLEGVDLSGDERGDAIMREAVRLSVPYVLMSVQPTLETTMEMFDRKIAHLIALGMPRENIILDPGYGFGKTMEENYRILFNQQHIADRYALPILTGISRKRMIWQKLNITPASALNGTTILNTLAVERGASILRVHDVAEAKEVIVLLRERKPTRPPLGEEL